MALVRFRGCRPKPSIRSIAVQRRFEGGFEWFNQSLNHPIHASLLSFPTLTTITTRPLTIPTCLSPIFHFVFFFHHLVSHLPSAPPSVTAAILRPLTNIN